MSEHQADEASPATSTTDSDSGDDGAGAPAPETARVPGEIADDQLPGDLQPGEDNPLATHPDQTGNEDDRIGADREEAPQTAPMSASDADYASGGRTDDDTGGNSADRTGDGGGDAPGDGRVGAEEDDGSDALEHGGGGAG